MPGGSRLEARVNATLGGESDQAASTGSRNRAGHAGPVASVEERLVDEVAIKDEGLDAASQSGGGRHQQIVRDGLTEDLYRSTIAGENTAEKLGVGYASDEVA